MKTEYIIIMSAFTFVVVIYYISYSYLLKKESASECDEYEENKEIIIPITESSITFNDSTMRIFVPEKAKTETTPNHTSLKSRPVLNGLFTSSIKSRKIPESSAVVCRSKPLKTTSSVPAKKSKHVISDAIFSENKPLSTSSTVLYRGKPVTIISSIPAKKSKPIISNAKFLENSSVSTSSTVLYRGKPVTIISSIPAKKSKPVISNAMEKKNKFTNSVKSKEVPRLTFPSKPIAKADILAKKNLATESSDLVCNTTIKDSETLSTTKNIHLNPKDASELANSTPDISPTVEIPKSSTKISDESTSSNIENMDLNKANSSKISNLESLEENYESSKTSFTTPDDINNE